MRKEGLLSLPVAVPDPPPANGSTVKYVLCFRLHQLNGEKVLVMDAFDATCRTLMHRQFMNGREFIARSFNPDGQAWKWRESMIWNLVDGWSHYWPSTPVPILDKGSPDAVKAFLPVGSFDPENVLRSVQKYQEGIRSDQLHAKHQRVLARIEKKMELVRPLPDDLDQWTTDDLLKNERYLLYQYTGKKKQTANCSNCGEYVELEGMRNKKICTCPACGTKATALAAGITSKYGFVHSSFFCVLQKYGEDAVIARRFEVHRRFDYRKDDARGPRFAVNTISGEVVRSIMRKKGKQIEDETYEWGVYKKNYRNNQTWIPYLNHDVMPNRIYPNGLKEELAGTWAQYSGLAEYAEAGGPDIREDWYLAFWMKHPEIEMISKAGLARLASDMTRSTSYYYSLPHVDLSVVKRHRQELRQYGGGAEAVVGLKCMDDSGVKYDAKEVIRFCNMAEGYAKSIPRMMKCAALQKINDYVSHHAGASAFVHDLLDYWGMMKAMGANMADRKVLFPSNLDKAHNEAIEKYNVWKDEKLAVNLRKIRTRAGEEFSFAFGGLLIVAPCCAEDLAHEGSTLNHCVRSYAERIAKGETTILFVRKEAEPGTPYFTMEVRDGKVIQLRGKCNCSPKKDVAAFEKAFCEAYHLRPHVA